MKVKFENVPNMKLAGFKTRASFDNASKVLPEFWKNCFSANLEKLYSNGYKAKDAFEEFFIKSRVGSFGCSVSVNENEFDYLICGEVSNDKVPDNLSVADIPSGLYAKVTCTGAVPESITSALNWIFKEYLPGNPEIEFRNAPVLEYYPQGACFDLAYQCELWIPVTKK